MYFFETFQKTKTIYRHSRQRAFEAFAPESPHQTLAFAAEPLSHRDKKAGAMTSHIGNSNERQNQYAMSIEAATLSTTVTTGP